MKLNDQQTLRQRERMSLTLVIPRGAPPREFSLPPQSQKESDQSHLGNLNYILCGHFDEKENGVTPFRWGRVAIKDRGVVAT